FMYVTPGIQNLIRENKSFRIDSEIQTGKKFGMQLLDDNLWMNFNLGKISAEETIDKSKNPGGMVDRMQRAGLMVTRPDDLPGGEDDAGGGGVAATGPGGGPPPMPGAPNAAQSEAERQAQIQSNRERMGR